VKQRWHMEHARRAEQMFICGRCGCCVDGGAVSLC
jgi:hypothetical protein